MRADASGQCRRHCGGADRRGRGYAEAVLSRAGREDPAAAGEFRNGADYRGGQRFEDSGPGDWGFAQVLNPLESLPLPECQAPATINFMKYRFSALITKENDWYVARCPELNVTSQGKNVEDARANLTEAMELYLETWGLPEQLPSQAESFWTTVEISQSNVRTSERVWRARDPSAEAS